MIGKIAGRVDYVAEDHALIMAGGVGYMLHCAPPTLARLTPGADAALYATLITREDLLQLFGFETLAEREWHRLLGSVQGVGARSALAILGALGPDAAGRAIALGDATAIRRAPGVGPKLAARIVNELRDRAPQVMALGAASIRTGGAGAAPVEAAPPAGGPAPAPVAAPPASAPADARAEADALSALLNLGYAPAEAAAAIAEAAGAGEAAGAETLIRAALRNLARDL